MKDNELDNLFRESLNGLDSAPPQAKNWNKEGVFERVQMGLYGDPSNQ